MLLGAFLSAILLTCYLPYVCAYVSISSGFPAGVGFLGHRSTGGMRPGRLLIVSTSDESCPVVTPFRCLFYAPVDGCCPPDTFLDGLSSRTTYSTGSLLLMQGLGIITTLVKPVILRWLGEHDDGLSHLRRLIEFDQQLIMGAS